eukprot:614211-Prorocentrum_minimum.AAC.2
MVAFRIMVIYSSTNRSYSYRGVTVALNGREVVLFSLSLPEAVSPDVDHERLLPRRPTGVPRQAVGGVPHQAVVVHVTVVRHAHGLVHVLKVGVRAPHLAPQPRGQRRPLIHRL